MNKRIKLCIIGGGPLGIGLGRELNDGGIDYDLYESEADLGGVWNGDGKSGRVYPSLHLISPKFNTQVPDYPMPDDYPVYPNHKMMLAYMRSYARDFGVYDKAIFNTSVTKLEPAGDGWDVTLSSGECKHYSFVAVCNGAQRVARYPDPPYRGHFSGEVFHSMDYKSPDQIRGKRVLVVGAGNSGCDIAVDAVHHGAGVYHSTRRGYHYYPKFIGGKPTPQWMLQLGNKFKSKEETMAYIQQVFKLAGYDGVDYGLKKPDHPLDGAHPIMNSQILYHIGHGDIQPKDDVDYFDGSTVHFTDGTSADVDVIIYATGYDRDFPFIDPALLQWKAGIPDLFIHIAPRNLDNIFFFGFVNAAAGLGDGLRLQGQFVRSYIKAFTDKSKGYDKFIQAKQEDDPDLGQDYFLDSHRHLWEVDFWKFIKVARMYRDMLDER
ncbi:MAG: NAD(P)-binding domain-containing protein [Methylobacter tundripaludum]|uniref:Cation diffusion facilitator CzcD-associated flavoprotein CzcO n=1 Tax=Methylobacter tundripaludum TaxID=173365 RepID=A0A2S6GMB0_9GAMM|nr:NAD(P)-binding domain-containing protein [Methylobacter tundripaludum]MCK9638018.1 NAD(P)-binding domain-containing protein [Methylobacter tundripaludum]PPK66296.1 cation diffusion facilitator CzcD-associated flavoprotein CzcO [Methylobacter tundripaludum]